MLLNDRIWSLGSETILSFSPWATAFQIVWHDFEDEKTPIQEKHPLKNLLQPKKKVAHHFGSHGPIKHVCFCVFFQILYNPFLQISHKSHGFWSFFPMGAAFAAVPPHRGRRHPRWGAAAARPALKGDELRQPWFFQKRHGDRYDDIWYIILYMLYNAIYVYSIYN